MVSKTFAVKILVFSVIIIFIRSGGRGGGRGKAFSVFKVYFLSQCKGFVFFYYSLGGITLYHLD